MNKTFKVVFNKVRGALIAVNEATSSVQKKGTKTVVAAVACLATGVAFAAVDPNDAQLLARVLSLLGMVTLRLHLMPIRL